MDKRMFDERRRIGTVKAAINTYRERFPEDGDGGSVKKSETDLLQKSSSRAREIQMRKRSVIRQNSSRRAPAEVESELPNMNLMAEDRIEELKTRLDSQLRNVEMVREQMKQENMPRSEESQQYAEVMRELECMKKELSKIKLDIASVVDEKLRTKRERDDLDTTEGPRKETEEVDMEDMGVDKHRVESLNGPRIDEDETERRENKFSPEKEASMSKNKDADEEIDQNEELESELMITLYDASLLQHQLKVVKEMEKTLSDSVNKSQKPEGVEGSHSLSSINEEMEAARRELTKVREEGVQFVVSMDIIRNELKHVREERALLKKNEEKADLRVQNLKSKLLRANKKLEAASRAEEKAKSIVTNLSQTLGQLKTETEVAKKENELVREENENIKSDIMKTESEIESSNERLQTAIQELEAINSSEASALSKLQVVLDNTRRARDSASLHSSTITIPKFEYEYLTGSADAAERIADKKVAALQAWIEAIKASEKEILMKIETAQREINEAGLKDEQRRYKTQRSLSARRVGEKETKNSRQKPESSQPNAAVKPRRLRKLRKATTFNSPIRRKKER